MSRLFVIYSHALPSFVNVKDWGTTRGLPVDDLPDFSNTSNALHVVVASVNEQIGDWAAYEGVVLSKDWTRDDKAMMELVYRQGNKTSREVAELYAKQEGFTALLHDFSWRY